MRPMVVRILRAAPHLLIGIGAAWNLLANNLEAARPLRGAIGWAGIIWQIGIALSQIATAYWTLTARKIKYVAVLSIHHLAGAMFLAGYFAGLILVPRGMPWWQAISTATGLAGATVFWHLLRYYQITRDEIPTMRALLELRAAAARRPPPPEVPG